QFPVYVVMAVLTYWLGLNGYMKRNEVVSKINKSSEQLPHLQNIAQQLDEAMLNQKLYLQADLNLNQLGAALQIKPYLITAALNKVKKQKFSDYINSWRIDEFKKLLQEPSYQHYSLLAIAHEVGFNSKASFNRIVKKMTGKSPSELKESAQIMK
ncbi:MAG: helix-turn-helix transcriptional regulator, partial [Bacteroidota bacterium]